MSSHADAEILEKRKSEDFSKELAKTGRYHSIELNDGRVLHGFISLEELRERFAEFPFRKASKENGSSISARGTGGSPSNRSAAEPRWSRSTTSNRRIFAKRIANSGRRFDTRSPKSMNSVAWSRSTTSCFWA